MDHLPDASSGAWLKARIDVQWQDMHAVVPHGIPAYARIFHPLERDRPQDTGSWHGHDLDALYDLDDQSVGWATVAQAFGKQMHALAQFNRLPGPETPRLGPLDAQGWRYSEPELGNLSAPVLANVARHLCEHTTTPNTGVSAIWEGWGGLSDAAGRVTLSLAGEVTDPPPAEGPGTGILPPEVVNGEKLELPGRCYYLFASGPRSYTNLRWVQQAPWHDSPHCPQSPNILWPADHAWVLVSEIDFDSTVIAGSRELITALVRDPNIEALILREGADLTWDADIPNRPVD